jgi:hypothetical protein
MKNYSEKRKKSKHKIDKIGTTDDILSSRGGLAIFVRYLYSIGIFIHFTRLFGFMRRSRKGQEIPETFKQILCFFIDGTSRHLTYFDELKRDQGYAAVIESGQKNLLSSHAVKRFFKKFQFPVIYHFRKLLQQLFLWRLNLMEPELIELGIDTMVMDNDDALKRHGVKPTYKKKKGFQPLQMNWNGRFVDAVFRGGDKHSNHSDTVEKMIRKIVRLIWKKYREDVPIIIRMDSGFFDQKIFKLCEELGVGYICGGKHYADIKSYVSDCDTSSWSIYGKGKDSWEYVEFADKRGNWDRFRRAFFCRYLYEGNGQGIFEFARSDTVIYTNLGMGGHVDDLLKQAGLEEKMEAPQIIENYHQRGSDELVNRGLKDFHCEQLPFKRFPSNTAWYYLMLISFFLLECFKEDVGHIVVGITAYTTTLRCRLIDIACKVVHHAGQITLKVTEAVWRNLKIPELWKRSSLAPQFNWV